MKKFPKSFSSTLRSFFCAFKPLILWLHNLLLRYTIFILFVRNFRLRFNQNKSGCAIFCCVFMVLNFACGICVCAFMVCNFCFPRLRFASFFFQMLSSGGGLRRSEYHRRESGAKTPTNGGQGFRGGALRSGNFLLF